MPDNMHWVGTWTATPAPAESGAFSNQTLRMNPRDGKCGFHPGEIINVNAPFVG